jgi:hypothetical protein
MVEIRLVGCKPNWSKRARLKEQAFFVSWFNPIPEINWLFSSPAKIPKNSQFVKNRGQFHR